MDAFCRHFCVTPLDCGTFHSGEFGEAGKHRPDFPLSPSRHHLDLLKNVAVRLAFVQESIGQDSKAVSQNYTHIEMEAMCRATDLMPDVFAEVTASPPEESLPESSGTQVGKSDQRDHSEASGGTTSDPEPQSE